MSGGRPSAVARVRHLLCLCPKNMEPWEAGEGKGLAMPLRFSGGEDRGEIGAA